MSSPAPDTSRRRSTPRPGVPLGQPAAGTAPQIAGHLIALRQAGLAETGGLRRSMRLAYRDELAVWAAHLQTHPDDLVAVLHLLTTSCAHDRALHDLPVPDVTPPTVTPDPDLTLTGPAGAAPTTLDRAAVMLAAFADWTITVTLNDGSTVTARPAKGPETPEPTPSRVTARRTDPEPAQRRTR